MKNLKTFIIGLICGAVIMCIPALANEVKQLIEVQFNSITITVNGEKVDADNILYNERTYVPLRKVAEMLGKYVSWDEETYTAGIDDSPQSIASAVTFDGEVVGMVGGKEIRKGQLDMYVANAKAEGTDISDEDALKTAKENIARDEAIISMAKENGIVIDEEFKTPFDNYIAQMNAQYGAQTGSENAFEQLLNAMGYSLEAYQRVQEVEYLKVKISEAYVEKYAPNDEQLKEYYNQNKDEFFYDGVVAKHIFFSTVNEDGTEMTASKMRTVEKEATTVYNKLIKGADFDKLMNEYGQDPGVAQNPDGYMFTKGEMVKEFEDAAYSLKAGEISKPVKSDIGYHIIKLIEKIEYLPLDNVNAKDYIEAQIVSKYLQEDIEKNTFVYTEV